MTVITPEVRDLIDRSVAEAPALTVEQARRLRAIWAPAAGRVLDKDKPAGCSRRADRTGR